MTQILTINSGKGIEVLPFGFHAGMYIAVQSYFHIRVAEYFAEAFRIHPSGDAVCGKGMAQDMEIFLFYTCFLQITTESVLVSPWLHRIISADYISSTPIIGTEQAYDFA